MTEIRWHARAGQGAKTAAQVLAQTLLQGGRSVQAFPEYGPERRGAPVRAYTRISGRPIRRHDSIAEPDLVVILEPSLAHDPEVLAGLPETGMALFNAEQPPAELAADTRIRCVPADRLAAAAGVRFANIVMLGAVAATLGEPPLAELQETAATALARKTEPAAVRAAIAEGYAWAS
jgi:pyruvate ferredoxin oxidoreductase gamma subunit